MSPAELEALRRMLFFSVKEAASLISNSSEQAWYRWENGLRPVPADIAKAMEQLVLWRQNAIQKAIDAFSGHEVDIFIIWYPSLEDWISLPGRQALMYRPEQSVIAGLRVHFPHRLKLIQFDREDYDRWRSDREDSEALRIQWVEQ
jgi:hypothetical protein